MTRRGSILVGALEQKVSILFPLCSVLTQKKPFLDVPAT